MNKTKTTQNEPPKAAGNTPAAGASIGGNVPTADAEKETPTAEIPETEDAAEAQAAAAERPKPFPFLRKLGNRKPPRPLSSPAR